MFYHPEAVENKNYDANFDPMDSRDDDLSRLKSDSNQSDNTDYINNKTKLNFANNATDQKT